MQKKQKTKETTEVTELVWEETAPLLDEELKDWEGSFYEIEDLDMMLFVPDCFEDELDEGLMEDGYFAYFECKHTGQEELNECIAVQVIDSEVEEVDADSYLTMIEEEYGFDAEKVIVNDFEAVRYYIPVDGDEEQHEIAIISLPVGESFVVEVYVAPVNKEGIEDLAALILSSVQVLEEE